MRELFSQEEREELERLSLNPDETVVAWKPYSKQEEFLSAPEFEVLYGGARGGGKTDALIIDALGLSQDAIEKPKYRALLIRPSFKELKDVIQRCLRYYPAIDPGVKWHSTNGEFIFSSGARVELAYLKHETDVFQFQGREFQYVGWEELTLHPSDEGYQFLMSSLRAPEDLEVECYVRATTNPGGPGHEWVKEHFRIPDEGTGTNFTEVVEVPVPGRLDQFTEVEMTRAFIPAKLTDNPSINPGKYLMAMGKMSEQRQRAFIHGRWDIVDLTGVILKDQYERAFVSGRILDFPIDPSVPVHTAWDLGTSDAMAVIMFQRVGAWYHFVDFIQEKGKDFGWFVREIKERGFTLGKHYLPHDAGKRNQTMQGLKNSEDLLRGLGLKPTQVVPKTPSVAESIELARQAMSNCRFHKERFKEGLKCLKNWGFKYDVDNGVFMTVPRHDKWSHGADAFRTFAQGAWRPSPIETEEDVLLPTWCGGRTPPEVGDYEMDWIV